MFTKEVYDISKDISKEILSDIIVYMKYSRYIDDLHRRETWNEICTRNMNMHISKFPKLRKEISDIYTNFVIPKKMKKTEFKGT